MFCKHNDNGYQDVLKGIAQKTLAYGDQMLLIARAGRLLAGRLLSSG